MQSQGVSFFLFFSDLSTLFPQQPQRTHIFVRLIKLQLISLLFPPVIKIKLEITIIGQQNKGLDLIYYLIIWPTNGASTFALKA